MEPTAPISLAIGFALRIFFLTFDPGSRLRPAFLGLWEGLALYRGLSVSEAYSDVLLLCALRLGFDFVFTETLHSMWTLLSALVLGFVISDVLSARGGHHDIRPPNVQRRRPSLADSPPRASSIPSGRLVHARRVSPRLSRIHDSSEALPNTDYFSRAAIVQSPRSSPSPGSVIAINIDPISTPPPPPPLTAHFVREPSDSGSHQDELQTPSSLAVPLRTNFHNASFAIGDSDPPHQDDESDELQTPLDLNIVGLPPTNGIISLVLEELDEAAPQEIPPDSVLEADAPEPDDDNLSELSVPTRTELSVMSDDEARKVFAKAELFRAQARAEEAQKRRLEENLDQAVLQRKVRDAFMLRREIEAVEERVKNLHRSAARRYIQAGNLSNKDGAIVDVHGLFIPEALKKVESSLQSAILNGRNELRVIVGKGIHSKGARAKLRPAIMEEMERQGIPCQINPKNNGVLILSVPP